MHGLPALYLHKALYMQQPSENQIRLHSSHPTQGNTTSIPHPPQNDTGPDWSWPGEHAGNLSQNYITEDDNDWIGLFGLTEDSIPGHPDVGTNSWFHSNMES